MSINAILQTSERSPLSRMWNLSTSTNYVNGGFAVALPEKSRGLEVGQCSWYATLLNEGWAEPPRFRGEQMTEGFRLWLLISPDGNSVAIVCYRDGSVDPLRNNKILCGSIVSKEDAHKMLKEFSPFC